MPQLIAGEYLGTKNMPSFNTHIYSSAAIGAAGTALGLSWQGWPWPVAALAGLAGWAGGMIPDLDSDTGRPVRIVGGLVSLVLTVGLVHVLLERLQEPLRAALVGAGLLILFNTVGIWLFKAVTRHRGMFHSLPAALAYAAGLAALFAPLGQSPALGAAAVGLAGVLSHLILDAVFSLSLGPLKLWSNKARPSLLAWLILAALTALAWTRLA